MKKNTLLLMAMLLGSSFFLTACSGGGGAAPPGNAVPVADAGPDASINLGVGTVDLDGNASSDGDGDPLTYAWSIVSQPPTSSAVLTSPTAALASLTPDLGGLYTIQLIVNDGTADSLPDTVVVTVINTVPIPDTGQTVNYTGVIADGEDSDYFINSPAYTGNPNGTVTDDITGLVWQKVDDNLTYNWYEATGTADPTSNPGGATDVCGSYSPDGQSDWRLPTKTELLSILDLGANTPAIESTAFSGTNLAQYWSATSYNADPTIAWSVDFAEGGAFFWSKTTTYYVRCVRGPGSFGTLTDNGDSTVTDTKTGLVWQQTEGGAMDWASALAYCEGLALDGGGWRLPNFKELESLTDDDISNPALATLYFPNVASAQYWSSSSRDADTIDLNAWYVDFFDGSGSYFGKANTFNVRCVR